MWWVIGVMVMVFNATFNKISVISWRSVLLVEEIGVPGGNHRPVECDDHWQRDVLIWPTQQYIVLLSYSCSKRASFNFKGKGRGVLFWKKLYFQRFIRIKIYIQKIHKIVNVIQIYSFLIIFLFYITILYCIIYYINFWIPIVINCLWYYVVEIKDFIWLIFSV
jgi:hypothetical protein